MKRTTALALLLALSIAGTGIGQLNWYEAKPQGPLPTARFHHGMAFDGSGILLYGGHNGYRNVLGDMWRWNGSSWSTLKPLSKGPGLRWLHGMVDFTNERTGQRKALLFGGTPGSAWAVQGGTWIWDVGSRTWTQLNLSRNPDPRNEMAMASNGRDVVLFGGYTQDRWTSRTTYRSDTWRFTYRYHTTPSWEPSWSTLRPSPRYGAAMAYDPNRREYVLFGGYAQSGAWQRDTWVLDDRLFWRKATPKFDPLPRSRHQMVYDSSRGKIVMTCGHTTGDKYLHDVFEWDGQNWNGVALKTMPSRRQAPRAVYDWRRNRLVLFGGYTGSTPPTANDIWELYTRNPASVVSYGTGCKGSHGKVAVLSARTKPILGRSLELGLTGALPNSWAVLALGTTWINVNLGPIGAPGCWLHCQPSLLLGYPTTASGTWSPSPSFGVPAVPALVGTRVYFQVGVMDAKANAFGLVTSNSIHATLGY